MPSRFACGPTCTERIDNGGAQHKPTPVTVDHHPVKTVLYNEQQAAKHPCECLRRSPSCVLVLTTRSSDRRQEAADFQYVWLQRNQNRCTRMQAPQVAFSLRKSHLQESNQEHGYSDSALGISVGALPVCIVLAQKRDWHCVIRYSNMRSNFS